MRIAVTHDNGNVFEHFGKTEEFKVYEVNGTNIESSRIVSSDGKGHGALAGLLAEQKVDVIICGGIGEGARSALAEAGIKVAAGASGNVDEAVRAYLDGTFVASEANCDHHHDHEEEHDCAESCGGCGESAEGSGCGGCSGCHGAPEITGKNAGRKCTVHYRGTFDDGTQFDSSYDRGQPLEFVCGAGMMIRGFDQAVADMSVGDTVDVHLMPEEAYGMWNPMAVMVVPFEQLPSSEDLAKDEQVMLADEYGRRFMVKVIEKDDKSITLDANHEMAGKELNFRIELLSVD